jgi:hypothetical protein
LGREEKRENFNMRFAMPFVARSRKGSKKRTHKLAAVLLAALPLLFLFGCSSSSSNSTGSIAVTLSPSAAQTLDENGTVSVTATVTNDSKSAGVTWALSSSVGTLTSTFDTATYTAPASVTSATSVTLTATSVTNTAKSASLTINLAVPPSVTTTSLPGATVGAAYSQTLAASGGVTPYTWSVASGGSSLSSLGLSLSTAGVISGTPTATGTATFTVKVTDSGNLSATSSSLTITASIAPLAVVTSSLPNGTVNTPYSQNLSASGGVAPYTWTQTSGTLPANLSLANSGLVSGTPSTTGSYSFGVQVTDSQNSTATGTVTLTIVSAEACGSKLGSESELNGEYAILMNGFSGSGNGSPWVAAGSFAANGSGSITAGDWDHNSNSAVHLTIEASGSSYVVGSDNRGCATLAFSDGSTETFRFALGSLSSNVATKGRIIEFDDTVGTGSRGSGLLLQQTTADFALSALAANYAFGMDGLDSSQGHYNVGGSLTNGSGTFSSIYSDIDDAGTLTSAQTGGTGSLSSVSSSTGRGTLSLTLGSLTISGAAYIVNANQLFLVSTGALSSTTPLLGGRAFATGSSFSSSSLSGNYVIELTGSSIPTNEGASAGIGLFTIGSGSLSGTIYEYQNATAVTNPFSGATYTVGTSSGRVAISGAGNHPPVIYLATSDLAGIVAGTDSSAVFGLIEQQTATSLADGNYFFGTTDPADNTVTDEEGAITLASGGAVTGTSDSSDQNGLTTAKTVSGSVTLDSSGVGYVGTSNSSVAITTGTKLYFIDESGGPAVIHVVEP